MNPFHRDQARIDAICYKLQEHGLLNDDQIHQLAHDWGDIEDACVAFSNALTKLRSALPSLRQDPKQVWLEIIYITGWFDELRRHMESAEKLIDLMSNEIQRRYPDVNPKDES